MCVVLVQFPAQGGELVGGVLTVERTARRVGLDGVELLERITVASSLRIHNSHFRSVSCSLK